MWAKLSQRQKLVPPRGMSSLLGCTLFMVLVLMESCSGPQCQTDGKDKRLIELPVSGGSCLQNVNASGVRKQAIRWYSGEFLPPGRTMTSDSDKRPRVEITEQHIRDDLGGEYKLDGFNSFVSKNGFRFKFHIWQAEIPEDATEIQLDMVVAADEIRLHMKDTVIKVNEPKRKWRSKKKSDDKRTGE